ncbi:hypothetical protein V8C37DRAFT_391658 [Trichoderma ceciliae]
MDHSLKMDEASSSSQNPPMDYTFGQQQHHHHHHHQKQQQQQEQHQPEGISSGPDRESYLERRGSNESASRRMSVSRPSHSGSGFLGTMR